jgi:hypothetical protein
MHAGGVPPAEEGFAGFLLARDEVARGGQRFLIDRFHPLPRQRSGVLDLAAGGGFDDTARTEFFTELGIFGVIRVLGLLLGVEVVEVAEKFIEAVVGRQVLVAVAEMVFAELPRGVALPGRPTLVMPVRTGFMPLMKAARPAVQLCWP